MTAPVVDGPVAGEPAALRSSSSLGRPKLSSRTAAVLAVVTATLILLVFVLVEIVVPAYRWPTTSTYSTRLGYPALLRRLGRPLPVETTNAEMRTIVHAVLGEGTMSSDPVLVPMVPVDRIAAVYVQPGQHVKKGDLLAELDSRRGQIAAETARLVFESAKAELNRVQIGSVFTMGREQPGHDAIDVRSLRTQLDLLRDETAMKQKLYEQGLLPKDQFLESKRLLEQTQQSLDDATLSLGMSSPGKSESERIATNALQQAVIAWQEALRELSEYKVVAPADGIVDRILIHAGEYNQMAGTPAFVLAAGLWFEGYFDQTALGEVAVDASVEVHLAARPDVTFRGRVINVNSIVSYSTGGPETARPIRPIGTGGPEWPATFQVRVELGVDESAELVPGLTGFARVTIERASVAVPEAAVISMSAGNGLLITVDGDKWTPRRVRYGAAADGWVEVLDGASAGDKVIVEGQRVLEPGDRIRESPWRRPSSGGARP